MFTGPSLHVANGKSKSLRRSQPKKSAVIASAAKQTTSIQGGRNQQNSLIIGGIDVSTPYIDEIAHKTRCSMYRDIYYHDPLAGAAIDMMCNLPFSEFNLQIPVENEAESERMRKVFEENLNRLKINTSLPSITRESLVLGAHIAILVYKVDKKIFTDTIPIEYDDCEIMTNILYGRDPIINVKSSERIKRFLGSNSQASRTLVDRLSPEIINLLRSGSFELDPLSAIYFPRRGFTSDDYGSSIYRRILPIYLLEKVLFRGTLTMANRRQNSITHVTAGDDEWEPTSGDLDDLVSLVTQADRDPLGAVIATRNDISINDISRSRDFWKWNDISQEMNERKLLAFGINENFMCLTGDNLISTEDGLVRLDSIANWKGMKKDTSIPINLTVKGIDGLLVKATQFWYRGNSYAYKVKTKSGQEITTTADHQFLVLSSNLMLEWKKLKHIKPGELLVKESKGIDLKGKSLKFNLGDRKLKKMDYASKLVKPKKMSSKLAWMMGFLVAEGGIDDYTFSATSADPELLNRLTKCCSSVFGLKYGYRDTRPIKGSYYKNGNEGTRKKNTESISFSSKMVCYYLQRLGLSKELSRYKTVPWSILQSNRRHKLAFLAGFLDGDGSISSKNDVVTNIRFCTMSEQLAQQIRIIISDLGYNLNKHMDLSSYQAKVFYGEIKNKLYCPRKINLDNTNQRYERNGKIEDTKWSRINGIPAKYLNNQLDSRWIADSVNEGSWFRSEDDKTAHLIKGIKIRFARYMKGILGYDAFKRGQYTEYFTELKRVIPSVVTRMESILKEEYYFDAYESKQSVKIQPLFDLTIDGPPAFVANGIVVHNSGDACLAGDQLIPTENGLVRIDEVANIPRIKNKINPIDVEVGSRYGNAKAESLIYNGCRRTYIVETSTGNRLKATKNHPVLVLDSKLKTKWVRVDELKEGDTLCMSTKPMVRTHTLPLELSDNIEIRSFNYIDKPKFMTPDLAYFIGALIAEGSIGTGRIYIPNTDEGILTKITSSFKNVFGLDINRTVQSKAGSPYKNGNKGFTNFDNYQLYIESEQLIIWLDELGLYKVISKDKDIPWCILEADKECQIAFLAAYLDCNGSVGVDGRITFYSISQKILSKMQLMFNAMGVICERNHNSIVVQNFEVSKILGDLKLHIASVQIETFPKNPSYKARSRFGIPIGSLLHKYHNRKVRRSKYGSTYLNNKGKEILVTKAGFPGDSNLINYDSYASGYYDDFLNALQVVDPKSYKRMMELLKLEYKYVQVTKITKSEKTHVYDISMGNKEPAFVAQGLIVHNSYNTLETALTVFMEQLESLRDSTTTNIFTNKLFPLISTVNGFINTKGKQTAGIISNEIDSNLHDSSNLIIPTVEWHKKLSPRGDEITMEMMEKLTDKGVPFSLRAWASAGGFDLDKLIGELGVNVKDQKEIARINSKVDSTDSENEDNLFTSSIKAVPLGKRKFKEEDSEIYSERGGKKHLVTNQHKANKKLNEMVAKAGERIRINSGRQPKRYLMSATHNEV